MSKPIIDFIIGDMNFSDNHNDNTILSVADLHIAFKSGNLWQEVVKGVNFSLKKGETLGLVGESGSGKSVSSLAIMGLLDKNNSKISHGSIIFNGSIELLQLKESLYRQYRGKKIAMIFQEPMTSLNPVKKCGNQLMEMILQHENCSKKEARNRTLELFKEVLLPDPCRVFSAYPHELSGGQKQRVMIAMAVSCKPDILIADEPTTALDVSVQKSILELIADVQKKYAMGVLFISHDLNLVHKIADRIAVIYKGEIVECGEKESIFNNPQHPYTKGLLACRPPLDCRPERLPTVDDYLNGKGVSFRTTVAADRQKAHADIYKQEPILRVKDLRVEYTLSKSFFGKAKKTFRAVNDISFDLYRGETLGLVGESGCGKTTLGRAIMQLVEAESDSMFFEDKAVSQLDKAGLKALRKHIQIIFQDPYSSLNPRISVGDAIAEPLKTYNIEHKREKRRAIAMEMMEKVGLSGAFYNRYPHEFSGGQRQRIGIARALVLNPKIVICDESVSALDVSVQAKVLNLLADLKKELGLTYIFISHDLAVVKYVSDRMMVMRSGKMIQIGEADEIYSNPQDSYTKSLIEAM